MSSRDIKNPLRLLLVNLFPRETDVAILCVSICEGYRGSNLRAATENDRIVAVSVAVRCVVACTVPFILCRPLLDQVCVQVTPKFWKVFRNS